MGQHQVKSRLQNTTNNNCQVTNRLKNTTKNSKVKSRLKITTDNGFDVSCLTVYESPFPKIRIGRNDDGGYVVANLPGKPYDAMLGAGVGADISFEIDWCKRYPGMPCLLYDGTVAKLPKGQRKNPAIQFIKKNIGPVETENETNLHAALEKYYNIFLKMDIEGAELPWLESLSSAQLSKVAQIAMEFHHPFRHKHVFDKLNETHYLIHIHANSCAYEYTMCNNVLVPVVFEATYLNKKFFTSVPGLNKTVLPIKDLDYSNDTSKPDLLINYAPFVNK